MELLTRRLVLATAHPIGKEHIVNPVWSTNVKMVVCSTKTLASVIVLVAGAVNFVTSVKYRVVIVEISTQMHARAAAWAIGKDQHVKLVQSHVSTVQKKIIKNVDANARSNAKMVALRMWTVAAFVQKNLEAPFVVALQRARSETLSGLHHNLATI